MEVLLYIALFTLLMGSAFIIAYQLIQGASNLEVKNTVQEEGNFVLRKINWALTGIDPASTPSISGPACEKAISVVRSDGSMSPVDIRLNTVDGKIEMRENGGSYSPITTENISVDCLTFTLIAGAPAGITATARINGLDFIIAKYQRK